MRMLALVSVLVATALLGASVPARAEAAFDSAYQFESAFLGGLQPGDTGQFSVFFANTGTTSWIAGTGSQMNLAACRADKVTCGVTSELAAWNPGSWVAPQVYAKQAKAEVVNGDSTAFTYSIKVPAGTAAGTYRFNGDLVRAETGLRIHPEGYYQEATVGPPPVASPTAAAPKDVVYFVGNYDAQTLNDDVRLNFNAPAGNTIDRYEIQRALGSCPIAPQSSAFVKVDTIVVQPGVNANFTDTDRPADVYCYQIRTTDPNGRFDYSNQGTVTVFAGATGSLITSQATLTKSSGISTRLDAGDEVTLTFNRPLTVTPNATISVIDADCGSPASQSSGPATCSSGTTQTQAQILCGSISTCVLSLDGTVLKITLQSEPNGWETGSAIGAQFPVVITGSQGITDQLNRAWNVTASTDRSIGPLGQ